MQLHASITCAAKVVRKCVDNICIVFFFTFVAIHVIYLLLNYFNLLRQKAVSGKNPYSILVFASFCQYVAKTSLCQPVFTVVKTG